MGPVITAPPKSALPSGSTRPRRRVRTSSSTAAATAPRARIRGRLLAGPHHHRWRGPQPTGVYCEEVFGPVWSSCTPTLRGSHRDRQLLRVWQQPRSSPPAVIPPATLWSTSGGMVGVSVPIPVGHTTRSVVGRGQLLGDTHIHGPEGVRFYTKAKGCHDCWPKRGRRSNVRNEPD